jgi:hypothetical protein
MFFSLREAPVTAERRTTRRTVLGGVSAVVGLLSLLAATTLAQETLGQTSELHGCLVGNFSTVAPQPLLTLSDSVSGDAEGLGIVTGSFTVTIDFNHPVADGFVLVSKTGSLIAADGDKINLAVVGTFNVTTFDVHYVFLVTGGTGRFAGATGNGTWDVPPPTTFDKATSSGSGNEFFRGTITLPQGN